MSHQTYSCQVFLSPPISNIYYQASNTVDDLFLSIFCHNVFTFATIVFSLMIGVAHLHFLIMMTESAHIPSQMLPKNTKKNKIRHAEFVVVNLIASQECPEFCFLYERFPGGQLPEGWTMTCSIIATFLIDVVLWSVDTRLPFVSQMVVLLLRLFINVN